MEKENTIIREATPADNEGLVNLTSLTPMKGKISIRIDRKPDFFRLLDMRGSSFVFVAELHNKIIGSWSVSAVNVFINEKPETVYYLADFKIHPDYRRTFVAAKLGKAVLKKLQSINADLLFCTVADGNLDMLPFLRGKAFIPQGKEIGTFRVFEILPTRFKGSASKYIIEEVPFKPHFVSFFNNFSKTCQLGPVYSEKSFENTSLITASLNNEIVAAVTLIDTGTVKQNVLIKLPFILKCIITLMNAISKIFPFVRLPKIKENIRLLYIKSYACQPGTEEAMHSIVRRARNIAFEKKFNFLAIGIHEKDPFIKIFSGYPKFTFRSLGYIFSLKDSKEKIDHVLKGVPIEDYSLV